MQIKTQWMATTFAALLAACGGGTANIDQGGPNPPFIPPNPSQTEHLQTVVPPPTYGANTDNLTSFNAINQFRASLGLGLWAQNSKLDRAAQNHVDYEVRNKTFGHYETKGLAGFTGVGPADRAAFVGYITNSIGELAITWNGSGGIEDLINSVYHRSGLMNQQITEVGIGNSADLQFPAQCVDFSNAKNSQNNSPTFIAVYPLNDQKNVPTFMTRETPDPIPAILSPSSPISYASVAGSKLVVTKFIVTRQGTSNPLITQLITKDIDPNLGLIPSHEAYIVGVEPFLPDTTYNVHFEGLIDATPIKRNWHFTTGAK